MRPLRFPIMNCGKLAASFIVFFGATQFLVSFIAKAASTTPSTPAKFQVDAVILIVLAQTDGKILVPGESVRLNSDGTLDQTYKLAISGRVEAATLQPDGKCLIGHSDGVDESYQRAPLLQRYNVDGSLDTSFNTTLSEIDVIADIAVQPDARVLVGGYIGFQPGQFDPSLPPPRLKIIRLNSDGSRDSTFQAGETRSAGARPSFAHQPGGKIIVPTGDLPHLVRLNPSGTVDSSFQAPGDYTVFNLVSLPDGKIVIGGSFPPVGGVASSGLARLQSDGTIDSGFHPPTQYVFDHSTLGLDLGGNVLATVYRPETFGYAILRLQTTGSIDPSYNAPAPYGINTIVLQPDGKELVAGPFEEIQHNDRTGLARVNPDGSLDTSFFPIFTRPGTVFTLATQFDKVIAGGGFTRVNGPFVGSIVRLNEDSTLETSFQTKVIAGNTLRVETQSDGKLVVLNDIVAAGPSIFTGLLRLTADGARDTTFAPLSPSLFDTFALQPDDKILGVIKNAIIRLNTNGSLDYSFITIQNRYTINGLKVQPDGRILVFGVGDIGVINRKYSDGTFDPTFEDPAPDNNVKAVDLQGDGKVVVGGDFHYFGVNTNYFNDIVIRPYLARLQTNGGVDETFNASLNAPVSVVKVQKNGQIVIGGTFTSVNNYPTPGLARLNPDGTFDPSFSAPTEGGAVRAIVETPDGTVVAGGDFGVVTSVVNPLPGQIVTAGSATPFITLVVKPALTNIAEVRFLVNGNIIDTVTHPLVATPGNAALSTRAHAVNGGPPGFGTGLWGTNFTGLFPGTFILTVQVVDTSGNVTTSSPSSVTVVDPSQSPPPTFQIGSLVTGQILATQSSITVTASPGPGGTALDKLSLFVNGISVQQIKPAFSFSGFLSEAAAYSFVFKPPAPGSYALVVVATATNGVTSSSPVVAVTAGTPSRIVNVSTRMFADTGDNALIGGVIVAGTVSKHVVIRALGPSVGAAGIVGAMQDPTLEVRDGNGALVAQNDNWRTDPTAATTLTTLGLQPHDDRESALLATINPGGYTAIVRGAGNATGVALVEVYDLDDFSTNAKLANISTRGQVLGADKVMIGGFIVAGGSQKKVIIRAIGPSLAASGVQGALSNPTLELHGADGDLIGKNDDWQTTQIGGIITADQKNEIIASTIPPKDDHESAIVVHLDPGVYTAVVRGANDTTGIGLVEIYDLD
jgi:uncharacterized delta-60 repeat protein